MLKLQEALDYIDPESLSYQEWIHIGMALKEASKTDPSISIVTYDEWSSRDKRPDVYKSGECRTKWDSFKGRGITEDTIYWMAFNNGYKPNLTGPRILSWDSPISYDGEKDDSFIDEITQYIKLLFKDDEIINYNLKSYHDEQRDKYGPTGVGTNRKASEILADLEKYRNISMALEDYNENAGGWIRFNPVDGNGCKDENITAFRYCLIESDEVSIEDQFKKILELKLPCAAIVYSGGKSLHAIMHIDAQNIDEYKKRVNWVYDVLNENGLPVDTNNKNPSRMSRLPGLKRGDTYQKLVRGHTGLKDFIQWEDYIKNGLGEELLPDIVSLDEVIDDLPPLKPELIHGVLRQGHKMIISGASKSGKSFSLIDLTTCIAEGKDWLGFKCKKGKVLYINMEIDSASFWDRIIKVYKSKEWEITATNIDVWNLRGFAMPAEKLVNYILRRAYDKDYSLIVLDPIYKIQAGDENSAGDISKFTNQLDRLVTELGCSVVYCHHHSKGMQSFKRSMDRSSGSGVFARDADAIIDIIELSNETFQDLEYYNELRAFRIEGTLREFEGFEPVNVFYDFPVYQLDEEGILDDAKTLDDFLNSKQNKQNGDKKPKLSGPERFYQAFNLLSVGGNKVPLKQMMDKMKIKKRRFQEIMKEVNDLEGEKNYAIEEGNVIRFIG